MVQDIILSIFNYFTFSLCLLFAYQTVVNILIFRQHILNSALLLPHIGLCLLSALYSGLSFLIMQGFSSRINLHIMMILWITGSGITFFYIRTLMAFLKNESKTLKKISCFPLISAVGGVVGLVLWSFFDVNLLLDPQIPHKAFQNIFMARVGGFNPHSYIKGLSLLIIIPSIYSFGYFIKTICKSPQSNNLLMIGIVLSCFVTINDVTISIIDSLYLAPLMFLTNVFEILRITYANQIELGKRLNAVTYELIQSNKLVEAGSYYSTLAHEVSNPIHAAKAYFDLFRAQINTAHRTAKMDQYEKAIIKQFNQTSFLLSNVKKFTKPSLMDPPRKVEFSSILKDSLDTIKIKAYYAGVNINFEVPEDNCQLLCQPDQLVQVFTNLLNNSIESIADLEQRWIHVKSWIEKKSLKVSVMDSGHGVPTKIQDQIWESRFTTKKEIGNGLGLSICKTIIENHRGLIQINTESPNTEFVIELPMI